MLSVNVQLFKVGEESLQSIPPPWLAAVLPVKVQFPKVGVEFQECIPLPKSAVLFVNVQFSTVGEEPHQQNIPPP
jgi:hypothetical protein